MGKLVSQIGAAIVAVVSFGVAIFQILLFLGLPLAEYSWGGKYRGVLPFKIRIFSLPSALVLVLIGYVFLIYTKVIAADFFHPTNLLIWIITIFMGINTLGNAASKSKKERTVMTPVAGLSFIACLVVSILQ